MRRALVSSSMLDPTSGAASRLQPESLWPDGHPTTPHRSYRSYTRGPQPDNPLALWPPRLVAVHRPQIPSHVVVGVAPVVLTIGVQLHPTKSQPRTTPVELEIVPTSAARAK